MSELLDNLRQLIVILGRLLWELGGFALAWSLLIAWIAWWLWGVNWERAWPALAQGAWIPVVLLTITSALVWSHIAPGEWSCLGIFTVPNFLWQLGGVGALVGLALFCGWLQGVLNWAPAEVNLEPPEHVEQGQGHH